MAVFERTRGNERSGPVGEFVGRELQFVTYTANAAIGASGVDSALERIVRSAQTFGTVTIVGTPSSATVTLVMEGISNIGTAAALSTAANASLVGAMRTISSVTIAAGISGSTFA
jgi:threonine dehydrogenase-like Zn-dependent dehydrogenase